MFVCFILQPLNSQTIVTGSISTSADQPLFRATVMIEGSFDGTFTEENGTYFLESKLTGEQRLLIRCVGYETKSLPVNLFGDTIRINCSLKETTNELNTITINAGSFEAGDKNKSVTLSSVDMITIPGSQGNVVGALQFLPGTSTNGESGKLFVRGGSSDESQTYIDGTIVPVPYNPSAPNTAVRSKFNPFMFDGTVFSTGGFSAEYGQAMSSVLLLETKGIQEEDQFDISILSVGLGLAGTKKWDHSAVTLSADFTYLGPYLKLVPQSIDWIDAPSAENFALNYRYKTKNGLLKLYSTFSHSKLSLNQEDLTIDNHQNQYEINNQNYYTNLNYHGTIGDKWILKTGGSFTSNSDKIMVDSLNLSNSLLLGHLKAVASRRINQKIKLNLGAESFLKLVKQDYHDPFFDAENSFKDVSFGTFSEIEVSFSKNFVGRFGGRLDYSKYANELKMAPRLSLAYKTSQNSQISIACGTFYQQINDDYLLYTSELAFERADQYMLNYQVSKNKRTVRAEVYLKSYKNLVKFTSDPFYIPSHYTNNGTGHAAGLDFFFRDQKTIRNGDFWISYGYLDTKRNYLDYPSSAVPNFASKHNLSFVYKHWILKWRSYVGASFNYSSSRFYHDPNKSTFNSEKMKPYQSLNLNWTYLHRENVIFYGSVSNVLGYQQEFGYEFSSEPNSEGVYDKKLIQPAAPRFFILGCFITLSKTGSKNQLDKIE